MMMIRRRRGRRRWRGGGEEGGRDGNDDDGDDRSQDYHESDNAAGGGQGDKDHDNDADFAVCHNDYEDAPTLNKRVSMEKFELQKSISQLFGALACQFLECEPFSNRSFRTTE